MKKDNLRLEHITPYLSYGLKAKLSQEGVFNLDSEYPNQYKNEICTINNFYLINGEVSGSMIVDKSNNNYGFDFDNLSEIEIILRPLTELHSRLLNNEFEFTTCENTMIYYSSRNYIDFDQVCYSDIQILLKNHYDIFGLIEKGLAIDKNTL